MLSAVFRKSSFEFCHLGIVFARYISSFQEHVGIESCRPRHHSKLNADMLTDYIFEIKYLVIGNKAVFPVNKFTNKLENKLALL